MNLKHSIVDAMRGADLHSHLVWQVQSRGVQCPGKEDLGLLAQAAN